MSNEENHRLLERQKNVESYNLIKTFFDALRENGLAEKKSWTPEEALKIQALSKTAIDALPESIRSIKFPNGGQVIFGEKEDQVRVSDWDLMDIKKYADRLKSTISL